VIADSHMLLLQWRLRHRRVLHHTLVVAENEVDPSNGIPIILSMYRRPSIMSTAIRNATKSETNVEDSTVFCLLECHKIGALFTKMRTPVWDRRVSQHPAWSVSMKQEVTTETPLGSGAS
jgi:hypothetical protein